MMPRNRSKPHWSWACVLTGILFISSLSTVSAQDYKAVERRLGEAVSKGEITLKQASIMLDALKQAGDKQKIAKPKQASAGHVDHEAARKQLEALVKAGKLTKEQAAAKMKAIKTNAAHKGQNPDQANAYLLKLKQELGAAMEAGKISKDDAVQRYESAVKKLKEQGKQDAKPKPSDKDLAKVKKELAAAVKAGKMTVAEAKAKWLGLTMKTAVKK